MFLKIYILFKLDAIDFFHHRVFRIYSEKKFQLQVNENISEVIGHSFPVCREKIDFCNLTNFYLLT